MPALVPAESADAFASMHGLPKDISEAAAWLGEDVKRAGVLKKGVRRTIEKNLDDVGESLRALRDTGQTFLREFYAGKGELTVQVCRGGHTAFQPTDILFGVDLKCDASQQQVLQLLDEFRPWLATVAFPCGGGSRAQQINIARGFGQSVADRYQEDVKLFEFAMRVLKVQAKNGLLGLAENPQGSEYWKHELVAELLEEGLYVFAHADQCSWNLRDSVTQLLRNKPTSFLVTAWSSLVGILSKRCTDDHWHHGPDRLHRGHLCRRRRGSGHPSSAETS